MTDSKFEDNNHASLTTFFTVITPDYTAQARVLVKSIVALCSPKHVIVYIVGRGHYKDLFRDLQCDVELAADIIGQPAYDDLVTRYGAAETCFALKPMLAEALLAKGASQIIFVDADCLFLSAPTQAEFALKEGASAVFTPHILRSAAGQHYVDDRAFLRSGSINIGFFGISSTNEARELLAWWKDRVCADCTVDDGHGTYYEQKWLDLAQSLFEGVTLIRDQGYNIAYWNMHQRPLKKATKGLWTVDAQPVVFVHFSRWAISTMTPEEYAGKHIQNQAAIEASLPILEAYLVAVKAEQEVNGIDTLSIPVDDQQLPDGSPITQIMRRALWRNIAVLDGKPKTLLDVLNAPSPRILQFPPYTLSNFYEEFWLSRPDLKNNKFDVDIADGLRAFIRWIVDVGQDESKIPECLMSVARRALQLDAEMIKQHCHHLEEQVESQKIEIESQKIEIETYEHANAESEARIAAWLTLSESRTFRMLRAYRSLRSRLCGQKLDEPF